MAQERVLFLNVLQILSVGVGTLNFLVTGKCLQENLLQLVLNLHCVFMMDFLMQQVIYLLLLGMNVWHVQKDLGLQYWRYGVW